MADLELLTLNLKQMKLESENTDWIENPPLLIADFITSACVGCGKPVKDFDKENNNCCDECWLSA